MPRAVSGSRRAFRVALGIVALAAAAVVAPVARSAQCGAAITQSTKLKQDVGPCPNGALTITADNITVDLGGHRIFGSTSTGDAVGVLLASVQGVELTNGTISNFDAGVVISGGGSNRVTDIHAIDNVGLAGVTDFGDGILISSSTANIVKGNEIRSNGPFSGISVIGTSNANKINRNTIQDNDVASNADENNDVGIRLEAGTAGTTLKRNVISFSGLDGVAIFENSSANVLVENTVKFNGFHDKSHRKGDGIRVFGQPGPDSNVLTGNVVQDNAANGIILSAGATGNRIQRNKASRNGFHAPGSFDLVDLNPGCDQNSWLKNSFITRSQTCVR